MKNLADIRLLTTVLSLQVACLPVLAVPLPDHETKLCADKPNQVQSNVQSHTQNYIYIAVIGEVQRPGGYSLLATAPQSQQRPKSCSSATVTKAIQAAGGITENADVRRVQIRRQVFNETKQTIDVNLYKYLSAEDLSQDVKLQDGDAVVVPFAPGQ
ncbi:MAG: SLBB domain-containing protein [Nostoc sp. C3-bin3]|nr:SLBB domain-containing protein [Nostoc sp. C3-bin3]